MDFIKVLFMNSYCLYFSKIFLLELVFLLTLNKFFRRVKKLFRSGCSLVFKGIIRSISKFYSENSFRKKFHHGYLTGSHVCVLEFNINFQKYQNIPPPPCFSKQRR